MGTYPFTTQYPDRQPYTPVDRRDGTPVWLQRFVDFIDRYAFNQHANRVHGNPQITYLNRDVPHIGARYGGVPRTPDWWSLPLGSPGHNNYAVANLGPGITTNGMQVYAPKGPFAPIDGRSRFVYVGPPYLHNRVDFTPVPPYYLEAIDQNGS